VSHLGDDAEAFFQEGDAGTYDGGPRSVMPSTRNVDSDDAELTTELTAEQIERRGRLKRLVTTIVGVCGAAVLVLAPIRLVTSHSAAPALETLGPPVTFPRAGAQPAALPEAPRAVAPVIPPRDVASVSPSVSNVTPPPRALSGKASVPVHGSRKTHAAPSRAIHRADARVPAASPRSSTLPVSAARRTPSTHLPPTATFPD
jgi:hypothetical protein